MKPGERLPDDARAAIIHALCDGESVRSIARTLHTTHSAIARVRREEGLARVACQSRSSHGHTLGDSLRCLNRGCDWIHPHDHLPEEIPQCAGRG